MATYSEEELQATHYNDIIKIAKELDVYKPRSKKVYLIKKILRVAKVLGTDENTNPTQAKDVLQSVTQKRLSVLQPVNTSAGNDSFTSPQILGEQTDRRSTFNLQKSGSSVKKSKAHLPTGIVKNRRSTFSISSGEKDGSQPDRALAPESPRRDKRSGALSEIKKKELSIKPSFESEGSNRRDTFVVTSLPKDRTDQMSLGEEGGCRRSTFLVVKTPLKEDEPPKQPTPKMQKPKSFEKLVKPKESKKVLKIKSPAKIQRQATRGKPVDLCKTLTPARNKDVSVKLPATTPPKLAFSPRPVPKTLEKKTKASAFDTPASKTPFTPGDKKSSRVKMPNFSSIHAKQFSRMESVIENKERHAKRALDLMSPLRQAAQKRSGIPVAVSKLNTTLPATKSTFKVAPTMPRKEEMTKRVVTRNPPISMDKTRDKGRALIQGVRANKRFLLQMQMRNLNA